MRKSMVVSIKKNGIAAAAVVAVVMMLAGPASADEVLCSNYGGVIDIPLDADVVADVDCTVGPSGFVHGNIYARGSKVRIQGGVNGNISQQGRGGVILEEGAGINGNIEENGPGGVWVRVGAGKVFNGDIREEGPGDVRMTVMDGGLFNGNIEEKGRGSLITRGNGKLNGSTKEEGPGKDRDSIAAFSEKAYE